jgi:hypothetical protein
VSTKDPELKIQENGKYILEMFPKEYTDLHREIANGLHPKLLPIIALIGPDDLDMKLAHIAAYCEVMLDGDYSLRDRMNLCRILTEKLKLLREAPQGIILS